ncbi:HD domain-containing phosphohydrolase [Geobacillus sp. FSL W8-0032]|uniref:HD family phosphohydrolase n=1 Tax=Geobacillus subterraneus TaxID=129338 RepID=A0A679G230_9BACL|nr:MULTISPECIES: HD-GYP domain-containing protein [Geobacillus]KYD24139.1 hypothetical protein B4113_2523 [Geobacillus sp. B4113_201601]BBW98061.1 HD family phosphohydrolase [Geobacillus subterraneus]
MVRVNRSRLREGCVLADDVLGPTKRPIIPKNTIITEPLLHVLEKFLIDEVEIEPVLANGEPFFEEDVIGTTAHRQPISSYLQAVQRYKQLFQSWQSGLPIEIREIRELIIPLLEQMAHAKHDLLTVRHYASKDDYLYHHAVSVGVIAGLLAMELGYSEGECYQVALAGALADCGMAKVSKQVLWKSSALTEAEFNEVKQHPIFGYRMVQKIPALTHGAKLAVLQHHERKDGSGYPLGVQAEKIHPYSLIVAVADVFHAMTSERLYRRKQSPFRAIETIWREQPSKLDAQAVAALINGLIGLQKGTIVRLSDGQRAEVISARSDDPVRPIVKIIETGQLLPLNQRRDLFIDEIL